MKQLYRVLFQNTENGHELMVIQAESAREARQIFNMNIVVRQVK